MQTMTTTCVNDTLLCSCLSDIVCGVVSFSAALSRSDFVEDDVVLIPSGRRL